MKSQPVIYKVSFDVLLSPKVEMCTKKGTNGSSYSFKTQDCYYCKVEIIGQCHKEINI